MKTTPNYGWPVAEETDVVKQYPTTVDDPFKMALDADLLGVEENVNGVSALLGISGGCKIVAGSASPTISGSGGATVSFGGYSFAFPPWVVCCIGNENSAIGLIQVVHSSITVSQFAVRVFNPTGGLMTSGAVQVNYIAVQKPGALGILDRPQVEPALKQPH